MTSNEDNFLVIGHSGFLGKYIYKSLCENYKKVNGVSTREIDLTKQISTSKIIAMIDKNSVIIISAAITREKGDTIESMNTHIRMITNIARVLEKKRVKKCIFLSSTDVYGIPSLPITEETMISPLTYYALAKYLAEKALSISALKSKTDLLIVRFNGIYGPGQKNIGYGPNAFINSFIKNKKIELWGKGEELRDNLFVEDVARAIIALYKHNASGIFNIATGHSVTFKSMVSLLKQITKINISVVYNKRTGNTFDQVFDISKFSSLLPDFTFTPRKIAFRKTLENE